MSFSKDVKDEIIKKNMFKKEPFALLQGLFLSNGSLLIKNNKLFFLISNENEDIVSYVKVYLEKCFTGIETTMVKVIKNLKKKGYYELSIDSEELTNEILTKLGILQVIDGQIEISDVCDKTYMESTEKMTAFLIGMFLGEGTVSIPSEENGVKKYGYHFEFLLNSKDQADIIAEILSNFDIFPKQISRNEQFLVYLKNSEAICDVLSIFGATNSVSELMNQKIGRDLNNKSNRQGNCYSANLDKTFNASVKQLKAIETIQNTIGIENLPENLVETALARIANPYVSLNDLLKVLDNKITKGALAQRFNKIIEIAANLGDDNE